MLSNLSDRSLLILGSILCLIAAWCTIGYHHPDEHFQIWEFANYKLGHTAFSELAWEYKAQMRAGIQPFMAYCMVGATRAIGIENPFIQVFLMRLLCAAAALLVYWKWTEWLAKELSPQASRWLRIGLLFFWLMPYLNVRFSSETTSAISFFGGMLLLLQYFESHKDTFSWKLVAAGMLLGLSFFFRYQIAFAGIGLGAWLLIVQKPGWRSWTSLAFGAVIAVGLGLATDFWLYGEWVCAPYNYFFSNIVEGKAADFGVSPFWWYLTEMPMALVPPLSIILLVFAGFGLWKKPLHVLSWCVIPFVLAHALVGHKEVRFLFPMALPFFFFAAVGWEYIRTQYTFKPWMQKSFNFLLYVNAILLVLRIFIPAKEIAAYNKFIWYWYDEHPGSTVYLVKESPQNRFELNLHFYKNPKQRQVDWFTDQQFSNDTSALKSGDLMLFKEKCPDSFAMPKGFKLKRIFNYYPDWILANNTGNWQSRTRLWEIYELTPE